MKKFLSSMLILIFIFTLLVPGFIVNADEPLYEKYEFKEDFKYNKEIVGHALKAAVPKILLIFEAEIRYKPMTFDVDGLAIQIEEWHRELSPSFSDEEISAMITEHIRENIYYYTSFGDYKESDAEAMAHGSGVVISEDGYIATNAHVASLDEETKRYLYMSSLDSSVTDDFYSLMDEINSHGVTLSEDDYYDLYYMLWDHACENMQVKNETTTLKVCFAAPDGKASLDDSKIYDAKIVEIGTQEGVDGLTQDTAILKIDANNLIALPLSETYPESNSDIYTAGYPAVADEIFSGVGSEASSVTVSIGEGTVARTIDIDGFKYKAIEITSTISGGNSGGPSVDNELNVEGLNTYASVSDNRYAYMISAEYVRSLAEDYDIGLGETSKTFLTGLQLLQDEYGDASLNCLNYVKELQKDTPYIDYLISVVEREDYDKEHPADTEEKKSGTGDDNLLSIILENPLYLGISIAGIVLILAIIIIAIVLISKSSKKKKVAKEAVVSSHSYTPGTIVPPIAPPVPPAPTIVNDAYSGRNQSFNQDFNYNRNPAPDFNQGADFGREQNFVQSPNHSLQSAYLENTELYEQPTISAADPRYVVSQQEEPARPRLKSTMKKPSSDDLN